MRRAGLGESQGDTNDGAGRPVSSNLQNQSLALLKSYIRLLDSADNKPANLGRRERLGNSQVLKI